MVLNLCLYIISESSWHLIFGYLSSVELYNWQTGGQCELNDLPFNDLSSPHGAVIDGVPVFCGGFSEGAGVKSCFKLVDKLWTQVAIINAYRIA